MESSVSSVREKLHSQTATADKSGALPLITVHCNSIFVRATFANLYAPIVRLDYPWPNKIPHFYVEQRLQHLSFFNDKCSWY